MRGALADTIDDNERLTREFHVLLLEMEKLQESRDRKDSELTRTKRELDFLVAKNHLLASRRMLSQTAEEQEHIHGMVPSATQASPIEAGDTIDSKRNTLEEYFTQCIKSQRAESARHKRHSRFSM